MTGFVAMNELDEPELARDEPEPNPVHQQYHRAMQLFLTEEICAGQP